jgi:hypothetical protein
LGPTSAGPSTAAAACRGARPKRKPTGSGLALLERFASYRCAAVALRHQLADSPNHKTARSLPTLRGVEPLWGVVAEPTDQPLGVVGANEAGDGLVELIDGAVQLSPQGGSLAEAAAAFGRSSLVLLVSH